MRTSILPPGSIENMVVVGSNDVNNLTYWPRFAQDAVKKAPDTLSGRISECWRAWAASMSAQNQEDRVRLTSQLLVQSDACGMGKIVTPGSM